MVPKRARAFTNFESAKFESLEASQRYTKSLTKKVPIAERGFNIVQGQFPDFDYLVNNRG